MAAFAVVLLAGSAQATTNHGTFFGTNVTFNNVTETSSFGDPEPLFGSPTASGDQLLFFPPNFLAQASGAGGLDQTGAQLQVWIEGATPTTTLDILRIEEFGDITLVGGGTAATGAFVSVSGFVTVTDTLGGAITEAIGFTGTFAPTNTFALPGDIGTQLWSGLVEVDIEQALIDAGYLGLQTQATKATLSFDNDLYAYSEAGTTSKIQKKVVDGPAIVISIVPEPATVALLGTGLLGLTLFGRRSRS